MKANTYRKVTLPVLCQEKRNILISIEMGRNCHVKLPELKGEAFLLLETDTKVEENLYKQTLLRLPF